MEEVKIKAVNTAIKMLNAVGDNVRWSVEFEGQNYGNADLQSRRSPKRNFHYARNETINHFEPLIRGAQIGDVVKVPFLHFDGAVLSTHMSAAAARWFGKGSYTTHKNEKDKCVEFMRIG
jgi:hypothetical protein